MESQFTRWFWKLYASHVCIHSTFLSFYCSLWKTWSLTKESLLPSLLFSFFYCLADLQFRKQHRFSCSMWVDDDFSKWMVVEACLHYRPLLNGHSSVLKENSNSGGNRTHVSEDTAIWAKPQRPLGHPACLVNFRLASVYVRALHLASNASQKFVDYFQPLFQGQPELEKKYTLTFCQVNCVLFKYAFTSGCWSRFCFLEI